MDIKWQILANQVEAKLAQMALAGESKAAALGAMGSAIANKVRLGFRLGRDPWGNPWKPLNPLFRTGQPLRDTGRLQRSITSAVQGDAAVIGTNVRYARTHQFGATILPKSGKYLAASAKGGGIAGVIFMKKAVIPSRPFLPITAGGQAQLPGPWARSALQALAKAMGL